jgi:hypothetical protein
MTIDLDRELRQTPISRAADDLEFRKAFAEFIFHPDHNVIQLANMPDYLRRTYGLSDVDVEVVYEAGWNRILHEHYSTEA